MRPESLIYILKCRLQAGSCWSTSTSGVATNTKSSCEAEAARWESDHALISAFFSFPWQLRILEKIIKLFHNNKEAQYPLLIIESFSEEKSPKFLSSKDTPDSKWSFFGSLFLDDAGTQANVFLLFHCKLPVTYTCNISHNSSHKELATSQVHLYSLTYFQLLFPAPSWNLTRNKLVRTLKCQ